MKEFESKKVLFLHAEALSSELVERARELGCRTIVANGYTADKAPAKLVADEAADIDFSDIEAMSELMHERNVDGIVTAYADSHLPYYYRLCRAMGFPYYCTPEQIELTTDKQKFKALCRSNGVPTVKEYKISVDPMEEELSNIEYPVMIKPADSSGSRGCRPCSNESELRHGIKDALSYSASGKFIAEKYMDRKKSDDIGIHYIFSHGKAYLASVSERYTNMQQKGFAPLTAASIAPGKHTHEYIREVDALVKKMFASIGIQEGTAGLQAFYDDEGFHIYEMGLRLTGGQPYVSIYEESRVDLQRAMIRFALTGDAFLNELIENLTPEFRNHYCNLHFLCSGGRLSRVEGLEEVASDSSVIHISHMYSMNSLIKADGTLAQVIYRVSIKSPSREALMNKIREIRTKIIAYDENDKPMMLKQFDPDDIGTGNC